MLLDQRLRVLGVDLLAHHLYTSDLGHAKFQIGMLFKHSHSCPQSTINAVALFGFQTLRCVLLPDVALIPDDVAFLDVP